MAKIIDIKKDIICIGSESGYIDEVRSDDLNFVPHIGDEVEIFKTETKTIVNKVEKKNNLTDGAININMNQVQNSANPVYLSGKVVNKITYILIVLFLGGIGGHKFFAGKIGTGFLYLLFFWTGIPALVSFFELISAILKKADANGNIVV